MSNLQGTKGTLIVHSPDIDFIEVPVTVLYHWPSRLGRRDLIEVQEDAVAEDGKTFTRNIAGRTHRFRQNRHGRWISRSALPQPYWATAPRSNKFEPGEQRFTDYPF